MLNMYRVEEDKKVAGVCAGLAKSFAVDPSVVRLFFILATVILNGFGFWVYLALVIFMPMLPEGQEVEKFDNAVFDQVDFRKYAGFGLIGYGVFAVIDNLNLINLRWLNFDVIWPVGLVVVGVAMLRMGAKTTEENNNDDSKEYKDE